MARVVYLVPDWKKLSWSQSTQVMEVDFVVKNNSFPSDASGF